jgi:hypothetical protein
MDDYKRQQQKILPVVLVTGTSAVCDLDASATGSCNQLLTLGSHTAYTK